MYTNVLFPTDGSDPARAALDYALDVAVEHDATLHVLTVADTGRESLTRIGDQVIDALETEGQRIVDEAADRARERGVEVVPTVRQGDPARTIVDYAVEASVDLVVVPTHGQTGLERVLLGSVTERVVGNATVPVVVVTPDGDRSFVYPPRTVLVPTDGSAAADLALRSGIDLATGTGAALDLLYVVETTSLGFDVRSVVGAERLDARGNDVLDRAVETAEAAGVDSVTRSVVHGRPYREIRSYVDDHDVDLVAVGTHGETDFSRSVLGGVTTKIVRTSPVPVLLRREPGSDPGPTT